MNTSKYIGVNVLDLLPTFALERMGEYDLERFAVDCEIRAVRQPDNDKACWLTEIYIELANQARALRVQRLRDRYEELST